MPREDDDVVSAAQALRMEPTRHRAQPAPIHAIEEPSRQRVCNTREAIPRLPAG